jgi:hypothetical protein
VTTHLVGVDADETSLDHGRARTLQVAPKTSSSNPLSPPGSPPP